MYLKDHKITSCYAPPLIFFGLAYYFSYLCSASDSNDKTIYILPYLNFFFLKEPHYIYILQLMYTCDKGHIILFLFFIAVELSFIAVTRNQTN